MVPKPDAPPAARLLTEAATALALLTRLPFVARRADFERGAAAVWAYPLAGLAAALIAGGLATLALALGLPAALAALASLAALVVTTGAMHEDGLADTADGFWGGWEPARRLEIMRDSHIGSYGVIALVLSLAARWAALTALFAAGAVFAPLIAAAMVSRAAMPAMMAFLPHARRDGLSHAQGRARGERAAVAGAIGLAAALLCGALGAALVAALAALMVMQIARAKINGHTGDTLGAVQQIGEIAVLMTLCAAL